MDLKNLHLISTYVLLCLGTTGLWMGESDGIQPYPIVITLCAIAAYFFTDRLKIMQLPHLLSNGLGLVILATIVYEFIRDATPNVTALAHFLVYLQVVKCFRAKRNSDFWQLYAINVLQVAIACVINRQVGFGLLLMGYTLLAVWTLSLFYLKRHQDLIELGATFSPASAVPVAGARLGPLLAMQILVLGIASLPLALIAFWAIPRPVRQPGGSQPSVGGSVKTVQTGFSETVRLDELGSIMESEDVVFNVWARNDSGAPVTLPPDILWRGQVFTTYKDKGWSKPPSNVIQQAHYWDAFPELREGQVELTVEQPIRTADTVFCPKPVYWADLTSQSGVIQFIRMEGRLHLYNHRAQDRSTKKAVAYRLITSFNPSPYRDPEEIAPSAEYLALTSAVPSHLTQLEALAARLTEGVAADDSFAKIGRIMNYLTSTGGLSYTLDIRPVNRSIDPIEDFLFERKAGHCEYFASSLALLLRSAGISTRVLNGFKGADYNTAGGYYQVRQLLAHSWVEAYIPEGRYWLTLDPTPADERIVAVSRQRSSFQPLLELADAGSRLWAGYIVGYNDGSQRELAQSIVMATGRDWIVAFRKFLMRVVAALAAMTTIGFWTSWQGVVGIAIVGTVIFLVVRFRHWFARLGWLFGRKGKRGSASAIYWPLYHRWLETLKRRGIVKRPAQTPKEFAVELQKRWSSDPTSQPWGALAAELVDCFYIFRFGGRQPDDDRLVRLENSLDQFVESAATAKSV